jgi:two-component system cell cycle sensor histidine kinase/response regulator CckA
MFLQVLNPDNYNLNVYALPMLAVGATIAVLGLFVLVRERGSRIGILFLLMCLSVSLYLTATGLNYASRDDGLSLFWVRISQLGSVFIPTTILSMTVARLGLYHRFRATIAASIVLSVLLTIGVFFTDLHVRGIAHFYWGTFVQYGALGLVFIGFFISIMVITLRLYWQEYRRSKGEKHRQRFRGLLIAFGIAYVGAVDFLPTLGVPVYPFGYVPILFFVVISAYIVIRYRLVDITPEMVAGQILETMEGAVIVVDLEGKVRLINRSALEKLEYQKAEVLGEDLTSILHISQESVADIQAGERYRAREMAWSGRTGKQFDVIVFISHVNDARNGQIGTVYVAHDISERKQAEEALQESEEKYRSLVETAQDPIFTADADGRFLYVNSAAARFGATPAGINGKTLHDFFPRHSADRYLAEVRQVIQTGEGMISEDLSEINGRPCWFSNNILPIRDRFGSIKAVQVVMRDIDGLKRAEQSLRDSEERLQAAVNVSQIGIFDHDHIADTIIWSPQQRKIHGWGPEEPVTLQVFFELVHPEDRERIVEAVRRAHDPAGDGIWDVEHRIIRRDGTVRWLRQRSQTFFEGEGDARRPVRTIGAVLDITDQKLAEVESEKLHSQLVQSQKMESIGQLAGGIAHDFNNILAAIVGYGHIIKMHIKDDDPNRVYLDQILTSAERAAGLTQSLLAFSRKQVINPKNIDLNNVILKIEKFLSRVIGEQIMLTAVLSEEELLIYADATQIEQILMNLAANARDAMPRGGTLMLQTGGAVLDEGYVRTHGYGLPGRYAVLTVSDTGEGMDEQTQKKMFDPFFTTKELGRGTGLGLAIIYGIVKQNNGFINVYSEVGKGTTIKIYLPLIMTGDEDARIAEALEPVRGGTETILLAEDNDEVRKLTQVVLSEFGYRVIQAMDGEEALRKFLDNRAAISLLIVDVIMPRLNGRDVYEEVKRIRPDVKVLFTSGYPADLIQKESVLEKGLNFLSKPASPQALLRAVRQLLDQ